MRLGHWSKDWIARRVKACEDLAQGKRLQFLIANEGYDRDVYVGNLVLHMFGKCGRAADARDRFDRMPQRNDFSWAIMAAAFSGNACVEEARATLERMPQHSLVAVNTLLAAYARCGAAADARVLFDWMPRRDSFSWNSLLNAHFQLQVHPAVVVMVVVFQKMPQWDVVSFTLMIQSHARAGEIDLATRLFDAMPLQDVVACNAMLHAYASLNNKWEDAKSLFDSMKQRDAMSWTSIVLAAAGSTSEVMNRLANKMPQHCLVAWNALIQAHISRGDLESAKQVFDQIERPNRDVVSWNSMISGYCKAGRILEASRLFADMDHAQRDVITWTAMLSGCTNSRNKNEDDSYDLQLLALKLFKLMDLEGVQADEAAFICAIDACSKLCALAEGKRLHAEMVESFIRLSAPVWTALVGMYAQCGVKQLPQLELDALGDDPVTWNAVVGAFAHHGDAAAALAAVSYMALEGIPWDAVTVTSLLCGCSHAGLVDTAVDVFRLATGDHGVGAEVDHLVCVMDALGRAGDVRRAAQLLRHRPDELSGWSSVSAFWANSCLPAMYGMGPRK